MTTDLDDSDPFDFLYSIEERTWTKLEELGLTHDQVWDLVIKANDQEWPTRLEDLTEAELQAIVLLQLHMLYEKLDDDSFSQSALDWVAEGAGIVTSHSVAQLNGYDRRLFLKKQSEAGQRSKGRDTIGKRVVRHVLNEIPKESHGYPAFEGYIGSDCRLNIDGLEVGVIAESNERGTVTRYGFELPGVAEPEWYRQGSIRSIISRQKKSLSN